MQQQVPEPDESAYTDSIKRLTIAMREMLGMGPAADIVAGKNENPVEGKRPSVAPVRSTIIVPPRLPPGRRIAANVHRLSEERHGTSDRTVMGRR